MSDPFVTKYSKILDTIYNIFQSYKGLKLKGHETIHLILFVELLLNDYIGWQEKLVDAFDMFREQFAIAKKEKIGEYWGNYAMYTQSQADKANSLSIRHSFFIEKMFDFIKPTLKDETRNFGDLEREIIYQCRLVNNLS